jgi:peptidoglycan L-alanyl-D-glutamate endopeptidase CwlK
MSRLLDDCDSNAKPVFMELLARCAEAGVPVMIIFTRRTKDEQAALYAQGRTIPGKIVTWTLDSMHVRGLAIDICPYEEFKRVGPKKLAWDADSPVWTTIGKIGESLGLKWGIIQGGARIDLGHFEYTGIHAPAPLIV